jgi:hypothetical protein
MAKVAAKPAYEAPKVQLTTVRVTKMGAGKISNGVHHAVLGDEYYEAGEVVADVPLPIAEALEQRGFAEIQRPSTSSGRGAGL